MCLTKERKRDGTDARWFKPPTRLLDGLHRVILEREKEGGGKTKKEEVTAGYTYRWHLQPERWDESEEEKSIEKKKKHGDSWRWSHASILHRIIAARLLYLMFSCIIHFVFSYWIWFSSVIDWLGNVLLIRWTVYTNAVVKQKQKVAVIVSSRSAQCRCVYLRFGS